MLTFIVRRLPALALTLILIFSSGAALVTATPARQDITPVELSACEPPRASQGVTIAYNTNLELDSELLQGLLQQATTYVRRGTTSAAQNDYAQARRFYSYAVDYLNYLYNVYNGRAFQEATAGDTSAAIADYLRAFGLSVNLADVYDRRGLANAALNDPESAVNDIEQARQLVPQLRVNPAYAQAYYELGNLALREYDYQRAIDAFDSAIALDPEYFEAYHKRGGVHLLLKDYQAAAQDFSCGIELDPTYLANYQLRGRALAGAGLYEPAIEDFSAALMQNPRLALARIDRGLAYQKMGDLVQAITDFTWAILINPEQPEAYNLRGNAYGEVGLYQEAINDYDRAILLDPTNAAFYNNRAWAQLALNNDAAATLNFAQFALRANYTVPVSLLNLFAGWLGGDGVGVPSPTDNGDGIIIEEARG
jgi:tetratricopeptide (TPR) repeat protein